MPLRDSSARERATRSGSEIRADSAAGSADGSAGTSRTPARTRSASARCSGARSRTCSEPAPTDALSSPLEPSAITFPWSITAIRSARWSGLVEVLRGQQHGGALGDHAPDDLPDLVPAARVEPGRGLVEEDQFGGDDQARRDVDAPAHPAGVLLHLPVSRLGKTERVEQVGRPLPASAA